MKLLEDKYFGTLVDIIDLEDDIYAGEITI